MKSSTHQTSDKISLEIILPDMEIISKRILANESLDEHTKLRLSRYLIQLSEFELGRFWIKNKGALSGYWTYYIILGYLQSPSLHPLEEQIIKTAPVILATRQRFQIFQDLLHKCIQSNSVVCSIPCGVMADLLDLQLNKTVESVTFIGVDLDQIALDLASNMAVFKGKSELCKFFKENAWDLAINHPQEFDIITTSGLNIYESDDRVVDLYKSLRGALKPGGRLICSALSKLEEWKMSEIDITALNLQNDIFIQILQATWSNLRFIDITIAQLQSAGFEDIKVYPDDSGIFPTFEAFVPKL